jgi:hypothetical protein
MEEHTAFEPLISPKQVAEEFGLSITTVYRRRAFLGGIKLGGIKFRRSTVQRRIAEMEADVLAGVQAAPLPAGLKPRLVEIPKPAKNHLSKWGNE